MQAVNTERLPAERSVAAGKLRRGASRIAASDPALSIITGIAGFALGSLVTATLTPKRHQHKLVKMRLGSATVGRSLGALATGALALGASATGALAIGALAIGKLKIKQLDVERFHVGSFVEGSFNALRPA